ncbi:DUF1904 family protein [Cohnella suwonensis]|uniref:DUF1904 family protein n=1 Tax=Cohnella suwonensis TaxID=696072 RepID=A0ABW0M3B6_9BACL
MPHLLIRGLPHEGIRSVSRSLVAELAEICSCPEDYILLEALHTTAIFGGETVSSYPFVEVNWFDRGAAVRDAAAACIDRHIRSIGIAETEIAFKVYEEDAYYANGKRLRTPSVELESEIQALRAENDKLKEDLTKARKGLAASAGQNMNSRLYDALRE